MTLPLLHSLRRRLGVVIQCASDLREFLKNVSGIQILPTMLLLSMRSFIELLNFSRLSYHVWAKKMSMVYSCNRVRKSNKCKNQINVQNCKNTNCANIFHCSIHVLVIRCAMPSQAGEHTLHQIFDIWIFDIFILSPPLFVVMII